MSQMMGGAGDMSAASGAGGAVASAAGMPSDTLFGMPIGGGGGGTPGMDPTAMNNLSSNMQNMQGMASFLGDTPEERTKNARAFADMVQQLGKMGSTVAQSTIMQRMMKHQIRPIAELNTGQQSGGVSSIPSGMSADDTSPIMSRMGYK
jgi:hypothetical protein